MAKAYIEHVAVYVKDIDWYIEFFNNTLGFTERMRKQESGQPKQVWLYGGIQLIEVSEDQAIGKLGHLGIMAEDQQNTLEKIKQYDVKPMPQGDNWWQLPDGLCIEILQAKPGTVRDILDVVPWQ